MVVPYRITMEFGGKRYVVLGSTGKEDEMAVMSWLDDGINPEHLSRIVNSAAVGGYVNKKEEDMSSNFENLKTVFDLEYEDAEEFWTDLARAAEGIRQHDALHRIDGAFGLNLAAVLLVGKAGEQPEDELAKKRSDKVTTTIGDNNEGEQ